MKRTLKRESKVLEIVGGEALEAGRSSPVGRSVVGNAGQLLGYFRSARKGAHHDRCFPCMAPARSALETRQRRLTWRKEDEGDMARSGGNPSAWLPSFGSPRDFSAEVSVGSTRFSNLSQGR